MTTPPEHTVADAFTPSLPKGGGAIQSIGTGWGALGMTGESSFSVPLPISPGRGFTPSLSLNYSSALGNGPFGIGWAASPGSIRRNTQTGVPRYTAADEFLGPSGMELRAEKNQQGVIQTTTIQQFNGLPLDTAYRVTRYFPRVESTFDRVEHWTCSDDPAGFWLIHSADGNLHVFGKTPGARCADPHTPHHVAQWLLEESLTPSGEQIYYQYKQEQITADTAPVRDFSAQRYLQRVCYGNRQPRTHLALWTAPSLAPLQWHFELLFDYGERTTDLAQTPSYAERAVWQERPDPYFNYAYGFELGSRRLCQQILMFHYFPDETAMGSEPVLVRRLLLEYGTSEHRGSFLNAVHSQAFDASGVASHWPPVEFSYSPFTLSNTPAQYAAFDALQGPGDGQHYQLVDLYCDGMPGVLYSQDRLWHYREPVRDPAGLTTDAVSYGPLQTLPEMPVATDRESLRQTLADLNGDGQLEWIIAQPALGGFFTLNARRRWSSFAPFAALPTEFFHPQGQLADLMGNGVPDLSLIGPRSVRLYINQPDDGFEPGQDVAHDADDDDGLPVLSRSPGTEVVAFSDILGSGQQHLIRIRHHEIKCWPNLGSGRFGKGFVFATLPFSYAEFDASRVLLADLDGSGATDVLYLQSEHALIFMNLFGTGLAPSPTQLPWPQNLRYDRSCTVSTADLQGLGCSSLIVTMPHATPPHWRYDFVQAKPYLLVSTDNNMGASGSLTYRSSAQEWLDEKHQRALERRPAICGVPFALHLVTRQQQTDAISGNRLTQQVKYREGFYNSVERKFQGFGFLLETDTEVSGSDTPDNRHTQTLLRKSWFHTGKATDMLRRDYFNLDTRAQPLGYTLISRLQPGDTDDTLIAEAVTPAHRQDINYALSGSLMRQEIFAARDPAPTAVPYSVSQNRFLVRQVNGRSSVLPLLLESISYRYEREPEDPGCQHTLNLRWDTFGGLTHSVTVHYARRKTPQDSPPFSEPHHIQWWQDTHDPAQQTYYLTESRAQYIHLDQPQRWRLHLPYRQRANALVLAKGTTAHTLAPDRISYERFIDQSAQSPLGADAQRTLGGLSTQYYQDVQTASPYPLGTADFLALPDHTETAELDEQALKAYENLPDLPGAEPFNLTQALTAAHYHPASAFLPDSAAPISLWSIKKNLTQYRSAQGFYRARSVRPTESHGVTTLEHDPYYCHIAKVQTADGCTTRAVYDYRLQLPVRVTDPQGTEQHARYDAFGHLQVSSYFGQEQGVPVGFAPLSQYRRPADDSPDSAIKSPQAALNKAASASFYTPFSWMGQIAVPALRPEWVAQGYVLPSGHIRARARQATLNLGDESQRQLSELIQRARREPVHAVVLQADRYPSATEPQEALIRISLTCSDGFGRSLQTKQLAPGGMAYSVNDNGALNVDTDGKPVSEYSETRWRVSSRVEYNNKGLAIRNYRPYFANHHRYINDASLRVSGYSDQVFYDALGRATHTLNARGDLSRQTYCTWYTITEDENDTYGLEQDLPAD